MLMKTKSRKFITDVRVDNIKLTAMLSFEIILFRLVRIIEMWMQIISIYIVYI